MACGSRGRFDAYKRDRRETEAQWTANLRQYLGRYDPEMVSRIEQDRSRAYPKLTRVKVMSIVSQQRASNPSLQMITPIRGMETYENKNVTVYVYVYR